MKTIRVKAAPGRRVPIHPSIATASGGQLLIVGDEPVELPLCGFVRRQMRAGDLVEVRSTSIPDPNTPTACVATIVTAKES